MNQFFYIFGIQSNEENGITIKLSLLSKAILMAVAAKISLKQINDCLQYSFAHT